MTFGGKVSDEDVLNNFAAPVSNVPMPRWQRKALEASTAQNVSRPGTPRKHASKTPKSGKRSKTPSADRFIPNRSAMDLDLCRLALTFDSCKENGSSSDAQQSATDATNGYDSVLRSSLLSSSNSLNCFDNAKNDLPGSKILSFRDKAPAPKEGYLNTNRVLYSQDQPGSRIRKNRFRHIPKQPEKILDAPGLLEDFYLNLIDWGSNNVLAVALSNAVYLWNADSGTIDELCQTESADDCITSVSWLQDSNHLAIGTNRCEVQVWDVKKMDHVRTMRSHTARVGALAWNGPLLSSGARNGQIHNHDIRIANHHTATLAAHTQEVCGLKWSPNGTQLASGGNDNLVCIWDGQSAGRTWEPKFRFDHHTAAVKALAWCPWQSNLLATGGGTADRHLRFWNSSTGSLINSVDTKSQVCSVLWSPHDKELITSHGYSQNQLTVWKYPSLARMAELDGHGCRVLHMALSPDGQTVVSGAADETLRFWKVFATDDSSRNGSRSRYADKSTSSSSRSLARGVSIR